MTPAEKTGYRKRWTCQCKCGKTVVVLEQNLRRGLSQSCGCLSKDIQFTGLEEISGTYWSRLKHDASKRKLEFKITLEEVWHLFLKQERKCALSGVDIKFADNTQQYWSKGTSASLDRIDSSKGYTLNNVQWVHKDINRMKQNFPEERFFELCQTVAFHKKKSVPTLSS